MRREPDFAEPAFAQLLQQCPAVAARHGQPRRRPPAERHFVAGADGPARPVRVSGWRQQGLARSTDFEDVDGFANALEQIRTVRQPHQTLVRSLATASEIERRAREQHLSRFGERRQLQEKLRRPRAGRVLGNVHGRAVGLTQRRRQCGERAIERLEATGVGRDEDTDGGQNGRGRSLAVLVRVATKRVAEPVDGPDVAWPARVVAEYRPQVCDETGERGLGHVRAGPQHVVNLRLRQRAGPTDEQKAQQFVSLRFKRKRSLRPQQLTTVRIEPERVEDPRHTPSHRGNP